MVDTFIALALPVFKIDILAMVMPTRSANFVTLIFRQASNKSIQKIIFPSIPPLNRQVVFCFQFRRLTEESGHHHTQKTSAKENRNKKRRQFPGGT